ncbi:RDD family protein [Flagellimonas marina]|uniref:RDD family protein n=1 Tax=Flagellimonas marina TaxID=1775168 RepID=A0ABV8PNY7_9FLAO
MENEFAKVMSERTDEELIKIVTVERDKYNPTALEAADSEIENRKINTSTFKEIRDKANAEKIQKQKVDSSVVSSGTRFLHLIIDWAVWIILSFILSFLVGLIFEPTNLDLFQVVIYILFLAVFVGYYAFMELKYQKTVGKFITKTHVVKTDGKKPDSSDIIARTFCRLIPFDRLSFLFVKNGIHDYLSKTKVVRDDKE